MITHMNKVREGDSMNSRVRLRYVTNTTKIFFDVEYIYGFVMLGGL